MSNTECGEIYDGAQGFDSWAGMECELPAGHDGGHRATKPLRCQAQSRGGSRCHLPLSHPGLHQDTLAHNWVLDHDDDGQPVAPGQVLVEYRTRTLVEVARVQDYLDDGWQLVQP